MSSIAIRGSLYIDGQWRQADSGKTLAVTNPATEEALCQVAYCGAGEVARAVDAAQKAFHAWKNVTPYQRAVMLRKVADLIRQRKEEIARVLTLEQGKPLAESRLEVEANATFFDFYAAEGTKVYGEIVPGINPKKRHYHLWQPIGVCALVSPWNFPLFLQGRKIAPALAAGCTVVCRPSKETPLCLIKLFECLEDAGIPAGVANLVVGPAGECMEVFYNHLDVRQVSFSGSTEIGKEIMRRCAEQVKNISIELGGHAPFLGFPDYGAARAAELACKSKFRNAGQSCVAATRFYVHESMYKEFVDASVAYAKAIRVGNGMDEGVTMGPLAEPNHLAKTLRLIEDARRKGAKVLAGGGKAAGFAKGYFVEPTVLVDVTPDMELMKEEPFCPIMPILSFKTTDEALALANASEYGLASYVATYDLRIALRCAEEIEAGIVAINDFSPATVLSPFGGVKQSGIGREGGREGILEYMETKAISLNLD